MIGMTKLSRVVVAALCCALAAGPALADNYVAKDGNGNLISMAAKNIGGFLHPFHILEGLISGSGAPQPINVAADGTVAVSCTGCSSSTVGISGTLPSFASTQTFNLGTAGFTPTAGAVANLSVSTTSSDVALPAGTTIVVTNAGASDAAFRIQVGAGTAAATDMTLKAGAAVGLAVGSATHISAITASGTTTLNIQGGAGAAAGYGGGSSGGGGGGGPVTAASGAYASGSLAAGAVVDIGTGVSPAANTVNARLATINTTLGTPFQAGGSIGNTTFASTQSGTWNITNVSGTVSLPTGAATSANQSTEITSLGTIATNSGTQATAANQTSIIGSKAPGTAAASAQLTGCVYTSAGITLTTGQQAALQCDSTGHVLTTATGSGGGAITAAASSYAAGAFSAGAGVDGWDLTEGAKADTAYAGSGSASVVSVLKGIYSAATGGIPAGSASIGNVGLNAGSAVIGVVGNTQGSTTSGQSGPLVQGAVTTGAPSYTTAQTSPLSLTTAGALRVDPSAVTAPTSVADGSNVTFGAKADAATCATANTAMACFRQLHADVTSSIPAGSAVIGVVGNTQGSTTSGQSGPLVQCAVTTANPAYTTAQTSPASCNINGALRVKQAPGTQESCASGNVAAATAACTLAASAGHTTYITGFQMTAGGSTAAALVTCTLTGTITGTKSYTFAFPAGVAVGATPLLVTFNPPLPASAANTTIVASCPSGGAGNTNATMTADGFQE